MEIRKCEIWEDRECNNCHSQNDVKEIQIGYIGIALCKECRDKLKDILNKDGVTKS